MAGICQLSGLGFLHYASITSSKPQCRWHPPVLITFGKDNCMINCKCIAALSTNSTRDLVYWRIRDDIAIERDSLFGKSVRLTQLPKGGKSPHLVAFQCICCLVVESMRLQQHDTLLRRTVNFVLFQQYFVTDSSDYITSPPALRWYCRPRNHAGGNVRCRS